MVRGLTFDSETQTNKSQPPCYLKFSRFHSISNLRIGWADLYSQSRPSSRFRSRLFSSDRVQLESTFSGPDVTTGALSLNLSAVVGKLANWQWQSKTAYDTMTIMVWSMIIWWWWWMMITRSHCDLWLCDYILWLCEIFNFNFWHMTWKG